MWWREWKYGIGTDFMPYYWFAVNLLDDTWRPLPSTKAAAKRTMAVRRPIHLIYLAGWLDGPFG